MRSSLARRTIVVVVFQAWSYVSSFWYVRRSLIGGLHSNPLSLLEGQFKVTSHVESVFGVLVTSTIEKFLESFDGVAEFHEQSLLSREDLRHVEWLGEESLYLSCTGYSQLIVF